MKVLRTVGIGVLVMLPVVAMAYPPFLKEFVALNKLPASSKLATSKCAICHVGLTTKLNPYGRDIKATLASLKTRTITPAVLAKVAKLDSDKDGVKNGVEIKKDKAPGNPKIK